MLFGVTIAVWVLAFIVPTGTYETEETGAPFPGPTSHATPACPSSDRLMELFLSPINGLYGVENPEPATSGHTRPVSCSARPASSCSSSPSASSSRCAMRTGAIDNGDRPRREADERRAAPVLIAALMVLFSIGGTTEGMAEETLGFYALVIPLMLALGYDRMVAAARS